MSEMVHGPGSTSDDLVVSTVEDEILREALRQVESIDCDDEHWRIDPLPSFATVDGDAGDGDGANDGDGDGVDGVPLIESVEQQNRHNN